MTKVNFSLNQVLHSSIPRLAGALLVVTLTIAWNSFAFSAQIHDAAKTGNIKAVTVLLKHNPRLVSAKDDNGYTPLHYAAAFGHKDIAEALLANKADPNAKDNIGQTPLHYAAAKGQDVLVRLLIGPKTNVTINAKANDGSTALLLASQNGHANIVQALLDTGADPNQPNNGGSTPLLLSSFLGYTRVVNMLIAKGARTDAKDQQGKTPLYYASYAGNTDIVQVLINHGADSADKAEPSKYFLKAQITKIDTAGNRLTVKIIRGSVLGAENAKELTFNMSEKCRYLGTSGLSGLKVNDIVNMNYSGQLAIGSFNFANATGSGSLTYTINLIALISE